MSHTRPTISLGMIVKNEEKHMERLLPVLVDLFDEIVIVDTGSTDRTCEILTDWSRSHGHIKIDHFKWVNDFSKARQYGMDRCTSDYYFWLDADDEIINVDEFILWRDNVMGAADYWMVNYDYTQDKNGKSVCNFIRERIVKNEGKFHWRYFLHEGLVPKDDTKRIHSQKCITFEIKHVRTAEDITADKNRNLDIFKEFEKDGILDARLTFYYGKELFDIGKHKEASKYLMEAAQSEETAFPDRILAIQYCAQSAYECEAYTQAEQLALNGVQLLPSRAEFWCLLGDARLKKNDIKGAMIFYKSARACEPENLSNTIFALETSYHEYPTYQLVQCYMNMGLMDDAKKEFESLREDDTKAQLADLIEKNDKLFTIRADAQEINEIVISTPPGSIVGEWDEDAHKVRGLGGSETAAVEVARYLREMLGIPVKIFNMRKEYKRCESGVEYVPLKELGEYFQRYKPKFHIAWRHSVKLSNAPMFTWCHDLQCIGAEQMQFDKILALSPFHKHYLHTSQGVNLEKIELFRNGIEPKLWTETDKVEKNPMKVIFSSSPDRGLERCIDVCKKVREMGTPVELHLFYGVENMRKMGADDWADKIMAKVEDNKDFVHYHGNVGKSELIHHFKESSVWLYPADFIETYCITVLEALASGTYPMVRNMGALSDTIASAAPKEMYFLTDKNCETEDEIAFWAENLNKAILEKRYEKVTLETDKHSWQEVTRDLIGLMEKEGVDFGNTN